MKKRLVTSALPYVNNIPHLGNLIQVLSADCFARFCRLKGYETLYVCGTDEYGTASETRALQEGITPRELCDRYHAIHRDIYRWFEIEFDYFGRTSSPMQTVIVQDIFKKVDAAGYIHEAQIEQLYCEQDHRFLADRFVEGTCPKCGSPGARGDQCDSCGSLLDPTDLIDPHCVVCGSKPHLRTTKHLYLDLPKALPLLQKWIDKASTEGFWAKNAVQTTKSWIRDGLKSRAITRDLQWGIPVPKEGFEDKVFYVWFDAPIGYISITASYTVHWRSWWHNPDEVQLFQFIGKDNIPFHTVIFPATLLATGEPWTMLYHISSTEYLNYENGKFSKSKGIGVFGNDAQQTGIPADMWRFYLFYNRPEKADVLFSWKDFQEKVNGELIGNLSNLVNRTLTFVHRYYGGTIPTGGIDADLARQMLEKEAQIDDLFEHAELREAFRKIFALSSMANKAFQDGQPWQTRTQDPSSAARLIRTLVYLIRDLGILIAPFMPHASEQLLGYLQCTGQTWEDLGSFSGIQTITPCDYLFRKLEDEQIETLRSRYAGSSHDKKEEGKEKMEEESLAQQFARLVSLKVGRVVEVQRHHNADTLYILHVDIGENELRTIVSGIVPFYTQEELLDRHIVLVANLKSANFRGVKSYGMLLAASDPHAEPHTTCEVIFAPQFPVGTELLPEGTEHPSVPRGQIKANDFFSMGIYTEDAVVKIDGKPIGTDGKVLTVTTYQNGTVG